MKICSSATAAAGAAPTLQGCPRVRGCTGPWGSCEGGDSKQDE
jgi:hypothetical protein